MVSNLNARFPRYYNTSQFSPRDMHQTSVHYPKSHYPPEPLRSRGLGSGLGLPKVEELKPKNRQTVRVCGSGHNNVIAKSTRQLNCLTAGMIDDVTAVPSDGFNGD